MDYLVDDTGILRVYEFDRIKDDKEKYSEFLNENYKLLGSFTEGFDKEILKKRLIKRYKYDADFVEYLENINADDIVDVCKIINKFIIIGMIETDYKFRGSTFMEILENYEKDNNIKISDVEIKE